jgi:HEAT repeat protein
MKLAIRLGNLAARAIDVLEANMKDHDPNVRHRAAVEVMDRAWGKPKAMIEARVEAVDMSSAHLAALKELAEQGLRALPAAVPVLDITPTVSSVPEGEDQ